MFKSILHFLVAKPWIYDLVQSLAGRETGYRKLRPLVHRARGERLLDAGAGTGELARILDPTTQYVWLDNDVQKLSGFLSKGGKGLTVVGDITELPLKQGAVHTAVCAGVAHHLTDPELDQLLGELARVCRNQLVFADPLEEKGSLVSTLLWRYDRGSYPRTAEHLLSMLRRHFAVEDIQRYKIYHRYLLCIGRPARVPE